MNKDKQKGANNLTYFVVKWLIMIRTKFDELYFYELLSKRNTFYKNYMLPKICELDQ